MAEVEAKRSAADFLREQMVIGEVPSMSPAYAALEGILDHLRMQYQAARDWEAAEAVKASERKKAEEMQKNWRRKRGGKSCWPPNPEVMKTSAGKRRAS